MHFQPISILTVTFNSVAFLFTFTKVMFVWINSNKRENVFCTNPILWYLHILSVNVYLSVNLHFHIVIMIIFLCLHYLFVNYLQPNNFLTNSSTVLHVHSLSNKSKINWTFNFLGLLKLCYSILPSLIYFLPSSLNSFYFKNVLKIALISSFKLYCINHCQYFKGLLKFIYFRLTICFKLIC